MNGILKYSLTLLSILLTLLVNAQEPTGITSLLSFDRLPFFKTGTQVRYSGSIDRTGRNADWDWKIYEENGEYVLMDTDGAGCIVNILTYYNNLNQIAGKGKFKFYFDGAKQAQFEMAADSIGHQYPFVAPLADDWNFIKQGACRVRRSFVPMPFAKSCKVTFTEPLDISSGGWGHIIYHSYTQLPLNMTTFTGKENYAKVLNAWKSVGSDPKSPLGNTTEKGKGKLECGETKTLFETNKAGSIAGIRLKPAYAAAEILQNVWLKIYWDNRPEPAVNCPIGAFFGNELKLNEIKMLSHGMSLKGDLYSYFPMPFWSSAKVVIENKSKIMLTDLAYEIDFKSEAAFTYPKEKCGYFYAIYTPRTQSVIHQPFQVGSIKGRGHLVGGQITAYSCSDRHPEEGDVQVYIDGNKTPQVESDGSESWPPYGWGFPVGPQSNPTSAYDGNVIPWSMAKLCLGDWYPFNTQLDFFIEHGDVNVNQMEHSGALFYYAQPEVGMEKTDVLDLNLPESRKMHNYQVSGALFLGKPLKENDLKTTRLNGYYEADYIGMNSNKVEFNGASQFEVKLNPANNGVKLRRLSDQSNARQRAKVYVDKVLVNERDWYYADFNNTKIFLDDEFEIPATYTKGKAKITVRIEYVSSEKGTWNEMSYQVFSYK